MRLENAQQAVAREHAGLSRPGQPSQPRRPEPAANLSPTQMDEKSVRPKARTLSNLFRSKSLRIISGNNNLSHSNSNSNNSSNNHQSRQIQRDLDARDNLAATIDYLSTARPHKRSSSVHRNSSFFTPTARYGDEADALSHKNLTSSAGSGGGKLVLFLRRLFRSKRRASKSRCVLAEAKPERMRQSSLDRIIINNIHNTTTTTTTTTAAAAAATATATSQQEANFGRQSVRRAAVNLLSSPSSDSSGSNSLIEILDCSPAVNQSRRAFREHHLVRERNRASWRMVQRSDSSLSELSDCSTTASERLRRHLDEAYKRHRNCTSQREKEFIDSINVLRQASRHALPHSGRSSSKNRHATSKSVASGKSDIDTTSSLASTGVGADECHSLGLMHQHPHPHPHLQQQQQQQQPNCCICASYLDSVARLCPLAASAATSYCSGGAGVAAAAAAAAAAAGAAAGAGAYCPALVQAASPTSLSVPPLSGAGNPASDMCMCPLWRSMISNYSSGCQSTADSPPLIFNPISAPASHHLVLEPKLSQQHQQHQQQQQQQHNTTIDLKIEIGAELSKPSGAKLAGTNSRRSSSQRKHHHQQQSQQHRVVAEADSLDSDYTTTTSASTSS